jgi:hypothetical protein
MVRPDKDPAKDVLKRDLYLTFWTVEFIYDINFYIEVTIADFNKN